MSGSLWEKPQSSVGGNAAVFDYGDGFDALLRAITSRDQTKTVSHEAISPTVIGWVHSPLSRPEHVPARGGAWPAATLEILPKFAEGLDSLLPGQQIILLTWLHLADRGVLRLKSGQGKENHGVFGSRGQCRPNPIGIHETTIIDIERQAATALVRVNSLDAVDGTPLLDIKGYRWSGDDSDEEFILRVQADLAELGRKAHRLGLLAGVSGNISRRLADSFVITRSGAMKRSLGKEDFAHLDLDDCALLSGGKPSSESRLHRALYLNAVEARVTLHSHPPKLLALSLRFPDLRFAELLDLPVVEAEALRGRLGDAGEHPYGSQELAMAVGAAAADGKQAIWMKNHGLCVFGENSAEVLALTEELEQLANIRLMAGI